MELDSARIIVAGATGVLGEGIARELDARGARVALLGRDADRLGRLGDDLKAPIALLDLASPDEIPACVNDAVTALDGLDGIVIATGVAGFGAEPALAATTIHELFLVNTLGPISLIRSALDQLSGRGTVVALSAVVAEHPMAGLAAYSASKAALSAYLVALRRERRREGLTVLDVRPSHLDTGFETRALAGEPPALPAAADHRAVVTAIVDAMRDGRRELAFDLRAGALVAK